MHGCHAELLSLEAKIIADAAAFDRPKVIVMLGDYVDRGPESRRVLDHLLAPPPDGFTRICLAGNHDAAMLAYLSGQLNRTDWMRYGGAQTLFSYGLDAGYLERAYGQANVDRFIREQVPESHVAFLEGLPVMAFSNEFVFVHAGLRPGVSLERQEDADLINIRDEFLAYPHKWDRWIVHGHTRVPFPQAKQRRLGLETAVYETGRLSAVRIADLRGRLLVS